MAVSRRLRYEILRRDGHACQYCGAKAPDATLTVDHVIPVALGGSDKPENLVTACSICNGGKSASSPDAPFVSQVAADASRWSHAMKAAAEQMLADTNERDLYRSAFKNKWAAWSTGGSTVPLPPSWPQSIDSFMAAGLPMQVLLECVNIAMARPNVDVQDVFRYMCGVAWRRVSELQRSARSILAVEGPGAESSVDVFQQAMLDMAGGIFGLEPGTREWNELLAEARSEEDMEVLSRDELVDVLFEKVRQVEGRATTLWRAVWRLFEMVPVDMRQIRVEAEEEVAKWDWGHTMDDVVEEMLWGLTCFYANEYLKPLPDQERDEWLAGSPPHVRDKIRAYHAAKAARFFKDFGVIGPDRCWHLGDYGALCPTVAQYKVWLGPCKACPEAEPCEGHRFCQRHLEALIDRDLVLNFEPITDPWDAA